MKNFIKSSVYIFVLLLISNIIIADETQETTEDTSPNYVIQELFLDTLGHESRIRDIAITSDGRFAVSVSDDKLIHIWNLEREEVEDILPPQRGPGNQGMLFCTDISPDDRYIAVSGWMVGEGRERYRILIYDFYTGKLERTLYGHFNIVHSLKFSPDGRYLASGAGDRKVFLWNTETWELENFLEGHTDSIYDLAWNPDGTKLVSGAYDGFIKVWNIEDFTLIYDIAEHSNRVHTVDWSDDGRYIASGGYDRTARVWDAEDGSSVIQFGPFTDNVVVVAFQPGTTNLLVGGKFSLYAYGNWYNKIFIYDIENGSILNNFEYHKGTVFAAIWTPDGQRVLSTGGIPREIVYWEAESSDIIHKFIGEGYPINVITTEIDNPMNLVWASDYFILPFTFNLENMYCRDVEHTIDELNWPIWSMRNYEIDRYMQYFRILEASSDDILVDHGNDSNDYVLCRSFNEDGTMIAVGSQKRLVVYSFPALEVLYELPGHTGIIESVLFSEDDKFLFSASQDKTIKVWDMEDGKCLLTIFVANSNKWIAWTEKGYFYCTENAYESLKFIIDDLNSLDSRYLTAHQVKSIFYNPNLIKSIFNDDIVNPENEVEPLYTIDNYMDFAPPEIILHNPDKWFVLTEEESFNIDVSAELLNDHEVDRIEVILNGTNIYTWAQLEENINSHYILNQQTQDPRLRRYRFRISEMFVDNRLNLTVKLDDGDNRILIRVYNDLGVYNEKKLSIVKQANP